MTSRTTAPLGTTSGQPRLVTTEFLLIWHAIHGPKGSHAWDVNLTSTSAYTPHREIRQSIAMWGGTGVQVFQCRCRTWLDKILDKGNHTNVDAVRMQSVFSSVSVIIERDTHVLTILWHLVMAFQC